MFDAAPLGKTFGQVLQDVSADAPYRAGEIVFAVFIGANPRVRPVLSVVAFLRSNVMPSQQLWGRQPASFLPRSVVEPSSGLPTNNGPLGCLNRFATPL